MKKPTRPGGYFPFNRAAHMQRTRNLCVVAECGRYRRRAKLFRDVASQISYPPFRPGGSLRGQSRISAARQSPNLTIDPAIR